MKYWLLTTEYPPFIGGGIGTYCSVTAAMFAERGHEVTVFVADASVKDVATRQEGRLRLVRFNTSRTNSSDHLGHVTNISYEFAHIVRHFIESEGKPDIIEAQEYLGIAYYILQYKYLLSPWCVDVPVLITMHSPSQLYMTYNHVPVYRYPNFWICEMERFCLKAADQVISPSRYMVRELKERAVLTREGIAIVPNPFDAGLAGMKDLPNEMSGDGEIIFFGKLTVQKGAFRLFRYFQQLWDGGFNRTLHVIGGQDIVYHPEGRTMGDIVRKKYRKYIESGLLKLEDRIGREDIAARLSKAEVVVIPSDNDNMPYVLFEMMSLGRIVLVSRQGGQSEVVEDGVDGFIFDHNEPVTFATQLERILKLDKTERSRIAANAVLKVTKQYSADSIYGQKLSVLQELLRQPSAPKQLYPFLFEEKKDVSVLHDADDNNLLSVVVPYFNMGAYIDETIASLQRSLYKEMEIIIVNDGSTDELSLQKLDNYRNASGIKVIDIQNSGLATARNLGASSASGTWLAFLDADDTVEPSYHSTAITVLQHYKNVHFVGCWVRYFGNSGNKWPSFNPEPPLILNHNSINSSALVYRRSAFLAGGLNDTSMLFQGYEDYESVISMIDHGFGGVVIPETLFNYRVRHQSMFRVISKSKKLNLYQHISNKHQELYGRFAVDLFNLLNANGPGIVLDNPSLDYHLADNLPIGGRLSRQIIAMVKKNRFVKTMAYKAYKMLKK